MTKKELILLKRRCEVQKWVDVIKIIDYSTMTITIPTLKRKYVFIEDIEMFEDGIVPFLGRWYRSPHLTPMLGYHWSVLLKEGGIVQVYDGYEKFIKLKWYLQDEK